MKAEHDKDGNRPLERIVSLRLDWRALINAAPTVKDAQLCELVKAATEAADDLEAEIRARAVGELPRRIVRDLQSVAALRAALAPFQQANA